MGLPTWHLPPKHETGLKDGYVLLLKALFVARWT